MSEGINVPQRELVAGILWLVWKARNSYVFQRGKPNPGTIVDDALALHKSFAIQSHAARSLTKKGCDVPYAWMPPGKGLLKLNVDGSWVDSSSEASIAGICRDAHGVSIAGYVKKIRADSAELAETLALREALLFLSLFFFWCRTVRI